MNRILNPLGGMRTALAKAVAVLVFGVSLLALIVPAISSAAGQVSAEGMVKSVDASAGSVTAHFRSGAIVTLQTNASTRIRRGADQTLSAFRAGDALKARYDPATLLALELEARPQKPVSASIVAPAEGAFLKGMVTLQATARADKSLQSVTYAVDGGAHTLLSLSKATGLYEARIDTTALAPGAHGILVRATDVDGLMDEASVSFVVDNDPPTLNIVSPADGSIVEAEISLEVAAADANGVASVEYALDGDGFVAMAWDATSGLYKATIDGSALGDGRHTITVRVVDSLGNSAQATIAVLTDTGAPVLGLVNPDPATGKVVSGVATTLQVLAYDSSSGIASVEWQIILLTDDVLEGAVDGVPDPDPAGWLPMAFNTATGYWEASWTGPATFDAIDGFLYVRTVDASGKTMSVTYDIQVVPNAVAFYVADAEDRTRVRGTVTIGPADGASNRIGVEYRGDNLAPFSEYTVTISDGSASVSFTFTADARGQVSGSFEADTTMSDATTATVSVSGPGL